MKIQLVEAKELCLRLGYLPLALNLVGRYVQKRKISLAEILRRLEEKGLQHQALDVNKKDRTRTLNIKRGVAAAFDLSWEELSQNAQKLGCFLSLFALAPIPWDLVKNISIDLDEEEFEDAKIQLSDLHLVQNKNPYLLHQLIRDFFKIKLNSNKQNLNKLRKSFVEALSNLTNERKLILKERENIIIDTHVAESAIVTGYLLDEIDDLFSKEFKLHQENLSEKALDLSLDISSRDAFFFMRTNQEYLSVYLRALVVYEKHLGLNNPYVVKQYETFEDIYNTIMSSLYKNKSYIDSTYRDLSYSNLGYCLIQFIERLISFKYKQSKLEEAHSLEETLREIKDINSYF